MCEHGITKYETNTFFQGNASFMRRSKFQIPVRASEKERVVSVSEAFLGDAKFAFSVYRIAPLSNANEVLLY